MSTGRRIQNIYETPFEPYDIGRTLGEGQELAARELDQGVRARLLPDPHGARVGGPFPTNTAAERSS